MTDGQRTVVAGEDKWVSSISGTKKDCLRGGGEYRPGQKSDVSQHETVPCSLVTSYQQWLKQKLRGFLLLLQKQQMVKGTCNQELWDETSLPLKNRKSLIFYSNCILIYMKWNIARIFFCFISCFTLWLFLWKLYFGCLSVVILAN